MTPWVKTNIQVFWGEIAPCDHLVQIYENDTTFLNTLEGFAGDGFLREESVVIIATNEHLLQLRTRLQSQGFDVDSLMLTDQYIPLDAEECLSRFMVKNWPDEDLFNAFVTQVMARARQGDRKVRAFGEMVALLWAQGHNGATVRLETLWCKIHSQASFCLFCAYPKSGFTQNAQISIDNICKTHSLVIDGAPRPSTLIHYKLASGLN